MNDELLAAPLALWIAAAQAGWVGSYSHAVIADARSDWNAAHEPAASP